jgi:hypothetical protein
MSTASPSLAALLLAATLLAGCAHGGASHVMLQAEGPGPPGVTLSRALEGAQSLNYTVTRVDGEHSRFDAEHGGFTLSSLFGSDSNCTMSVRATRAERPNTSTIVIEGRARNVGSLVGCRKDAQEILRIATDAEKPPKRRKQPPFDPEEALHGGTFGY